MEEFTLKINLGNDAMQTPEDIAEALETIAARLRAGKEEGTIRDENGNRVGSWSLE